MLGRDALIRQVVEDLTAGRSVLLYGPQGIGKSAIVSVVSLNGVVVIDPFERITRQQASGIRRALDRGTVYLGAARAATRHDLGAVGRILWRFSLVRVRELSDGVLRHLVAHELGVSEASDLGRDRGWVSATVTLAKGRPGFATAITRFAVEWRSRHGYLPAPAFAFAAIGEDAALRILQNTSAAHVDERHGKGRL